MSCRILVKFDYELFPFLQVTGEVRKAVVMGTADRLQRVAYGPDSREEMRPCPNQPKDAGFADNS